ncbi:MAG: hypothetical protein WD851_03040 [Pirellulales bacterium]
MSLATIFVAVAAMAVNFGWQKADDGYEYLVQLEPETLQLLHDGIDVPIDSHVPEGVQPIRRVRIVVGNGKLPREELAATDGRTDTAVERAANYTPPADRRYAQTPAAAQPSAIDTMVAPLRKADDFFEQGFEKAVDGLENTGQAVRGAVDNLGAGVQDHLRRSKDMIVGSTPNNAFPAANPATAPPAAAPAFDGGSAWPTGSANGNDPSLRGLPAPPLVGTVPPAASQPAATNTDSAESFGDNWPRIPSGRSAESTTGAVSGSRMVPVEPVGSDTAAPSVPAWNPDDPNWPPASAQSAPLSFADWPGPTAPAPAANVPPPSPNTTADPSSTSLPPSPTPLQGSAATDTATPTAQSLSGWALAIIGLAGSVGCNFFLGFSYLDIRNKYRAALRRTSRSFGRPAASA